MAYIIDVPTFSDERGSLAAIDKELPFGVKRVYYIFRTNEKDRAGHRHKKNIQALVCLHGACDVSNHDGKSKQVFHMNDPSKCLILEPQDWHLISPGKDSVILVLASEHYDAEDYIDEPYL